jgi:hypothetical protein
VLLRPAGGKRGGAADATDFLVNLGVLCGLAVVSFVYKGRGIVADN